MDVGGPWQNRSVNSLAHALTKLGDELVRKAGEVFASGQLTDVGDVELLEVMAAAARVVRGAEAILVETTAQVTDRSDHPGVADRMTTRFGCGSVAELVQRVTRVSKRSASDLILAGRVVLRPIAPSSGEVLPAELPCMREALAAGEVGVDGLLAVAQPLRRCTTGQAAILAADIELAAAARGEATDAAPPACADDLRAYATVWAMYLDPDGAEPREAQAMRKRGVTLGVCRDGIVPLRGGLLPEVAAQFQLLIDSVLNPRVAELAAPGGPEFRETCQPDDDDRDGPSEAVADSRTRGQKQHDVLATILNVAAASGGMPQLGGAAPTLVVSVREEDLESGRGFGHIEGCDEPVSLSIARHIACSGAVQRVFLNPDGRILRMEVHDRVFNRHQRRAITLRDGSCVIPGCRVPAAWCEIHHAEEHARGGATHTDNGVLLCWFHHRTLDSSGWQIRMNQGVPEVRGPYWWDAHLRWRPVTKSPTRLRERVARRT